MAGRKAQGRRKAMAGLPKGCKSVAVQTVFACDLFELMTRRAFKQWGLSRAKQAAV